jgi:hypothetical protein
MQAATEGQISFKSRISVYRSQCASENGHRWLGADPVVWQLGCCPDVVNGCSSSAS